ncbi:hypothetical protein GCM10010271_09940 [Streptomyces kurssanovii]|nr:hypothetical protein GCM10010271_09940 [Streptomyces kurssanovii]
MHHDVDAAQLLGDGRVPHIENVPLGLGHLAPAFVQGNDLLDLLRRGQAPREKVADAGGGTGDGYDGATARRPAAPGRG